MHHRLVNKVIGLATGMLTLLSAKNVDAASIEGAHPSMATPPVLDERPLLFIDADNQHAAEYMLAAHRSHSSHRSHKSHYSSRGGGYSSPAPVYSPPAVSTPKTPSSSTKSTAPAAESTSLITTDLVRNIQAGLAKLGYSPGPANGTLGKETQKAIAMFQADQGLAINGNPSKGLLAEIQNELKKK